MNELRLKYIGSGIAFAETVVRLLLDKGEEITTGVVISNEIQVGRILKTKPKLHDEWTIHQLRLNLHWNHLLRVASAHAGFSRESKRDSIDSC